MASFYIPLTGLNADSTALNTIANNLANMNTTGYKSKSVSFSDLFYQQIGEAGSGDPIQRGSGTQVASIETDFSNGSPNSTGVDTNVALQGNGFFVVSDGGNTLLTRAGDFSLDQNGNLITADGLSVMGFPAINGKVDATAPLAPIHIPVGEVELPSATSSFGMTATLNSSAQIGDSLPGTVQVYDSLGSPYQATVKYTKTGTNNWSYSITLPDRLSPNLNASNGNITYNFGSSGATPASVDPSTNLTITGLNGAGVSSTINAPAITPGESVSTYAAALQSALNAAGITATVSATGSQLTISGSNLTTSGDVIQDPVTSSPATGSLTFDSNGNLVSPSTNITGITFSGLADGASNLNLTWELYGSDGSGNLSQVAQTSAVSSTSQNGFASGIYRGFSIGADGTVTATFKNGQKLNVGQLALGNVVNLQGLKALGSGEFETSLASGSATIGISGTSGLGTMQGVALEG
jgi:flagellar hook protein FlgE